MRERRYRSPAEKDLAVRGQRMSTRAWCRCLYTLAARARGSYQALFLQVWQPPSHRGVVVCSRCARFRFALPYHRRNVWLRESRGACFVKCLLEEAATVMEQPQPGVLLKRVSDLLFGHPGILI